MIPLVIDGSGNATNGDALLQAEIPYTFSFTKSASQGPTSGTLNLKCRWDQSHALVTTPETKSALETNLTGVNNDLRFESKLAGTDGDALMIEYLNTASPDQALEVQVSGTTISVILGLGAGTKQVETMTIVGTTTLPGFIQVTIQSAAGGSFAKNIGVNSGQNAAAVALVIRDAYLADEDFLVHFDIAASGDDVVITAKVAAADDATMNGAYTNGSSAGLTADATSTNTTAGVAPAFTTTAAQLKAKIEASDAAELVTVTNKAGNDGTGVVTAMALTNLAGGVDEVSTAEYPESPFLDESDAEISFDLATVNNGGFRFYPPAKGSFVATISGGTAGKVVYISVNPIVP